MFFPSFTAFNLLSAMLYLLTGFAVAKIISQDWKPHAKELPFFIIFILLGAVISAASRDISNIFFQIFRDILHPVVFFFYFHRFQAYSIKKSILLMFITNYVLTICTYLLTMLFYMLFPYFQPAIIPYYYLEFCSTEDISILEISHALLLFPVTSLIAALFTKATRKSRGMINRSPRLQTFMMMFSLIIVVGFIVLLAIWRARTYTFSFTSLNLFLITASLITLLMGFFVFINYFNNRHERLVQDEVKKNLQDYLRKMEQQQIAMKRFKHDFRNILLSLDDYIAKEDWGKLVEYYNTKIKPTSEAIIDTNFELEALGEVKVDEIKSILATKLIMAHNRGIDVTLDASGTIEEIPLDFVVLVRMLGILLDNAIEAVVELGSGKLYVGCVKWDNGISFIVKNSCQPDLPPLQLMWKSGFSTKGAHRGLGLSNLRELMDPHPHVMLKTNIGDGSFSQELFISEFDEDGNKI